MSTLSLQGRKRVLWFRLYGKSKVVTLTDIQLEVICSIVVIRIRAGYTYVPAGINMADRRQCVPHCRVKCHSLVLMWLLSHFNLILKKIGSGNLECTELAGYIKHVTQKVTTTEFQISLQDSWGLHFFRMLCLIKRRSSACNRPLQRPRKVKLHPFFNFNTTWGCKVNTTHQPL